MLINPFRGEDTVLNHLRFDFHGLVRLLQGLRLHIFALFDCLPQIFIRFFFIVCVLKLVVHYFTVCLLVVWLCLNFVGFFEFIFVSAVL